VIDWKRKLKDLVGCGLETQKLAAEGRGKEKRKVEGEPKAIYNHYHTFYHFIFLFSSLLSINYHHHHRNHPSFNPTSNSSRNLSPSHIHTISPSLSHA